MFNTVAQGEIAKLQEITLASSRTVDRKTHIYLLVVIHCKVAEKYVTLELPF